MRFLPSTLEDPSVALRALKTIALANGEIAGQERELLVAADALLSLGSDLDTLPPIQPEELAAAVSDRAARLQLIQACVVMALADGDASKDEVAALEAYRKALDVEAATMKMFKRLARGQRLLAGIEMKRRLGGPIVKKVWKARGLLGAYRFVRDVHGAHVEDPPTAWRYRRLGLLPEGTLGREYWKYSRRNEFAMPGELGGPDEIVVNHDFIHVLTGYDTDPPGEFEAAGFTAGMTREDPFSFVFFVMLQFHFGVSLSPVGTTDRGRFPPKRTVRAMERGVGCKVDFTNGWDHWPVIERRIDELRDEYGIAQP